MASNNITDTTSLVQLVDKIALELVLAEPGKDQGLLPVNSLLAEVEEEATRLGLREPIPSALGQARSWVDEVFMAGGFDDASIGRLRAWVEWAQGAFAAAAQGGVVAAFAVKDFAEAKGGDEGAEGVGKGSGTEATDALAEAPEPIELNIESDGELLREFTNESHEHLQNIELGVLTLEENPTDSATLNSIFRAFHTFKGGSGFLNLRPINHLAHELESLLDLARQNKLSIDSETINVILAGGDTLKRFVVEIEARMAGEQAGEPILISTSDLLRRVRSLIHAVDSGAALKSAGAISGAGAEERSAAASPVIVAFETAPVEAVASSAGAARVAEGGTGEAPAVTAGNGKREGAAPEAAVSPEGAGRKSSGATAVKVDTQKLDSLVDLVGEMVIAESMVMQDTDLLAVQSQQLGRNLAQLGRITKELQRVAMSLRMVPIRSTFQKMTRLVRDLSIKAGKQVELEMSGEDTELDRTIVEEISDPLVHMIRNSVDHGIEAAEKRIAAGKSPVGNVRLRAFHQGGNIVIEVSDDGAGLNRDRILAKAVANGLVPAGSSLSDKEAFDLIFAPGFSTAEKVTDISGRGVGMDVVRRNIEKLRGRVEIESTVGKGSRFTIFLPLTLAIIDGMIVGVGNQRYILPTLAVRESFRPAAGMVSSLQGRAELVNVRGRLLPLVRLHSLFGIKPQTEDPTQGIVIVIESDRESRCLLVDELVGKQEVVIKSLGGTFKQSSAVAGAAILGDGKVGLILDVASLVSLATPVLAHAA